MNRAVRFSALIVLGIAMLLASACQPTPTGDPSQNTQTGDNPGASAEPTIDFETLDEQSGPTAIPLPATIEWNRAPSAIIFRAEISGGTDDTPENAYIRNEVPPCTVYGDNRVVWTITNQNTDDSVVFDVVPDEAVRDFIIRLIAVHNFYGYRNSLATPEAQTVDTAETTTDEVFIETPVVERLSLTINNETYVTDSFSGWDYTYFREVMEACRRISTTPIAFQPQGAWVTVRDMGYNPNRPSLFWDSDITGLRLAEMAGSEPRWMTGELVLTLWEAIRSSGIDILFQDGSSEYLVTVEVPNITRSSPPPPSS